MGWTHSSLWIPSGIDTIIMVNIVGEDRYRAIITRTHLFPPWFSLVHEKIVTPIIEIVIMAIATTIVALFIEVDILFKLLSINILFIWFFIEIALIVRRYYILGQTNIRNQ